LSKPSFFAEAAMKELFGKYRQRVQMTLPGAQKNPEDTDRSADTVYQAATVAAALLLLISAAVL
jgi:hypothetical protein